MARLANKVSIITGGGSGIGRATARAMAAEGAHSCVVDVDPLSAQDVANLITGEARLATAFECDVSSADQVSHLYDEIETSVGPVDVLFNNAGICLHKDITETTFDEWQRTISVNLTGVWLMSREFILRCRDRGRPGTIVNTAAVNSFFAEASYAAYCASKGGIYALTKALAVDHTRDQIRVNCVCPGWVDTPLNDQYYPADISTAEAKRVAGTTRALLGRIGTPEEIAAAVVFLASDEASFFVGSAVVVDGGMSVGAYDPDQAAAPTELASGG